MLPKAELSLPPSSAAFSLSRTSSGTSVTPVTASSSVTISTVLPAAGTLSAFHTAMVKRYCRPWAMMTPLPSTPLYWMILPRIGCSRLPKENAPTGINYWKEGRHSSPKWERLSDRTTGRDAAAKDGHRFGLARRAGLDQDLFKVSARRADADIQRFADVCQRRALSKPGGDQRFGAGQAEGRPQHFDVKRRIFGIAHQDQRERALPDRVRPARPQWKHGERPGRTFRAVDADHTLAPTQLAFGKTDRGLHRRIQFRPQCWIVCDQTR